MKKKILMPLCFLGLVGCGPVEKPYEFGVATGDAICARFGGLVAVKRHGYAADPREVHHFITVKCKDGSSISRDYWVGR